MRWFGPLAALAIVVSCVAATAATAGTPASAPIASIAPDVVSVGGTHACAIAESGGAVCWGDNTRGQLGNGTTSRAAGPVAVVGLPAAVRAVASATSTSCALSEAGGVFCWGSDSSGQLGNGPAAIGDRPTAGPVTGLESGVASISAGVSHVCAVTTAGAVWCWGFNSSGQLGDGTTTTATAPVAVTGLGSGVVQVDGGAQHTCALRDTGAVACWGAGGSGRLGNGSTTSSTTPVPVAGLASGAAVVSAGGSHTCAITGEGGVVCWGANASGQLGNSSTTGSLAPVPVSGLASGVAALSVGSVHSCAKRNGEQPRCWGSNGDGQIGSSPSLGNVNTGQFLSPLWIWTVPAPIAGVGVDALQVSAGSTSTCTVVASGAIRCSGLNDIGQLGVDGPITWEPHDVPGLTAGVAQVSAGHIYTCAVLDTGAPRCWGRNNTGQLGNGTTTATPNPGAVSGLPAVAMISAGVQTTCAVTPAGGAWCWGKNDWGQVGSGAASSSPKTTPQPVTGLGSGVASVATGDQMSCALTTAGGVKCWGVNSDGNLGNGSGVASAVPVDVAGLTAEVVAMDVGQAHACAVTAAGAVRCWGNGSVGRLGDGGTTDRPTPVPVVGLSSGYVGVTASSGGGCAWKADGHLACWGAGVDGTLGNGTTSASAVPVEVLGLPAGSIAPAPAAWNHRCLVDPGGAAWCWGLDTFGQLGNRSTTNTSIPVEVAGVGSDTASISPGQFHSCAITTAGRVRCWGSNLDGALGVQPITRSFTVRQIPELTVPVPPEAPGAPTMGEATAGSQQVTLSWSAPTDDGGEPVTGYVVTPFVESTALPALAFDSTATTQVITGLTNGTTYTFTVAATNAVGPGAPSTPSAAVTPLGIAVTSDAPDAVTGQPVTLQAESTVGLTGTIRFYDGATLLASRRVTSGVATFTTTKLAPGTHPITASFEVTSSSTPWVSNPYAQIVGRGATTVAVAATPDSAVFGQSVQVKASVTPTAPAAGQPTGPVAFYDGGTLLGSANVSKGIATLNMKLPVGPHPVTAVYGGSTAFAGSASAGHDIDVGRASSATTVTPVVNPAVFGKTVTLKVRVTSVAPATGAPAGLVDLYEGDAVIATKTLASAAASFTVSPAVGDHDYAVVYRGSGNHGASVGTTTLTVQQASTTTTLSTPYPTTTYRHAGVITASARPVAPGGGVPQGTVELYDGAVRIASLTLVAGKATFPLAALERGVHHLTAVYLGTTSHTGSTTSAELVQTIT